jgi:hypothetical protein
MNNQTSSLQTKRELSFFPVTHPPKRKIAKKETKKVNMRTL